MRHETESIIQDAIYDLLIDWLRVQAECDEEGMGGAPRARGWEDHAELNTYGRERAAMLGIAWTDELESASRNYCEPPTADDLIEYRAAVLRERDRLEQMRAKSKRDHLALVRNLHPKDD